jgi:hypothetical protein
MEMSPKDELKRAHRQATFIGMAMISSLIIYVIIVEFMKIDIKGMAAPVIAAESAAMCLPAGKQQWGSLLFASRRLKFRMFFMEAWTGLEERRFHGACKGGGKVYQWKGGERVYPRFLTQ